MSFWIRRQAGPGKWHYLAVELPVLLCPAIVGVCVALLFTSAVQAPVTSLLVAFGTSLLGAMLIVAAKASLVRRGRLLSFGSSAMTPAMRLVYRVGWVLFLIGLAATLLGLGIVWHVASK